MKKNDNKIIITITTIKFAMLTIIGAELTRRVGVPKRMKICARERANFFLTLFYRRLIEITTVHIGGDLVLVLRDELAAKV